ncbi:MAG: hypothetical protein ACYCYR_11320 [Desulfobulbaceae bacterium]
MKKLTTLFVGLLALAMMTGTSMAAGMAGGEKLPGEVTNAHERLLSPNALGPGYFSDGVIDDEFRGNINEHYGVAPTWEGRPEEPRTMIEKVENDFWRHLAPNASGIGYFSDGVSNDEFRGTISKHYGVAPAWEGRPEEPLTKIEEVEKTFWELLSPNLTYDKEVY